MRMPVSRRARIVALLAAGALVVTSAPARAQDSTMSGEGAPAAVGPGSGTCTFDVRDQSIDRVIDYVRRAATEVNIIVAPEAQNERVTLAVRNMPWRSTLDEIARQTGCTVEEYPDRIRIEKPPRVSFSFEQADVSKVIRTIAALSGANIVSDPEDVKGMVTVNLIDVPWRRALTSIVATKGYKVVEEPGGILRVVSPSKLKDELETMVYQFRFLRPPPSYRPKLPSSEYVEKKAASNETDVEKSFSIIASLRKALEPEGTLEYINNSNSLVLKGTKPKLAQVEKMLLGLDREPQQIFVDLQFISTTNRDFFDIGAGPGSTGVQGSMTFAKVDNGIALPFNVGKGGFEDSLLLKDGLPRVDKVVPSFSYGSLDFSNTSYLLRLLRNDTKSRIVQAPKLFVLDNQEATIFVGESIRYAETQAASSQSGGLQFSIKEAGGSPVSVGFQLLLVPHVIPDTNKVSITLVPTQNSLSGSSTELPGFDKFSVGTGSGDQVIFLPRESSSTLVTTLIMEHGTTAVIGGLMQDTNAVTVQKVPVLGDIPLLGWLFKTQQTSKSVQQLMIFMTPYLVKDSARQRAIIEKELLRREPEVSREWDRLSGDPAPSPFMDSTDGKGSGEKAPKTPKAAEPK